MYEENLELRKSLILEGVGWDQTTIAAPRLEAGPPLERAARDLEQRLHAARTEQERKAITEKFLGRCPAVLGVWDACGVQVRGLKVTASHATPEDPYAAGSLVVVCRSTLRMTDCAILVVLCGGIRIVDGSDVEIRHSLVAAVWGRGSLSVSAAGEWSLGNCCRLRRAELPLRRDRHHGPQPGENRAMSHFRSRLARHPLRRQSADVVGNLIFGHARCGIYASGKTAATVKQNVFWKNAMADVLLVRQPRHHRREYVCGQPAGGAGRDRRL